MFKSPYLFQVSLVLGEIVDRAFFKSLLRRKNAEKIASGNGTVEIKEIELCAQTSASAKSFEIYASDSSFEDEVVNDSSMTSHNVDTSIPSVFNKIVDFFGRMEDVQIVPETDDEDEYPVENQHPVENPLPEVESNENLFPVENPLQPENRFPDENEISVSDFIQEIIDDLVKAVTEDQLPVERSFPVENHISLLVQDVISDHVDAAVEVVEDIHDVAMLETKESSSVEEADEEGQAKGETI